MLRKILAVACFALLAFTAVPSYAQQALVVDTCGTLSANLELALPHVIYQDKTGKLCTSGTGGGGGAGDASAANQTLQITQETAVNTVLGTQASTTWDGSAAAPAMSIWRYIGVKLEAIRVAITGTLTVATHAVTGSGNFASTVADGANVTLGAKADAKSTATDTTSITIMSVLKQISASIQAAVTSLASIDTKASAPLPAQITNAVNIGAVMNAGSGYETVAASQTGQALGASGATGDYLSHCVLYPVTTSPGVVTVFDSTSSTTNNVITFAGGASSLSNLAPISIPVGAVSLNGAWKVTTGANVLVNCYGKFT